jgi:hypothetical protein
VKLESAIHTLAKKKRDYKRLSSPWFWTKAHMMLQTKVEKPVGQQRLFFGAHDEFWRLVSAHYPRPSDAL